MLRAAYSCGAWVFVVIITAVMGTMAWFTYPFSRSPRTHWPRWAKLWARCMLRLARLDVEVTGTAPEAPLVFASNHQSLLDIPVLVAALPQDFAFVAKIEVFDIPLIGWLSEQMGVIGLKRGDARSAGSALQRAVDAVAAGRSVLMFPEGTRTLDGKLRHFKRGAAFIARGAGAPLVPVAIDGTYRAMRKGTFVTTPSRVRVQLGAPIPVPVGAGDEELALQLTEKVRESIQGLLDRPALPPIEVPVGATIEPA